jgi:hypothetical protein
VTRNVFAGLTAPAAPVADGDPLRFVQLTNITSNFLRTEAWLRNRRTNARIRLRDEEPFDTFEVRDAGGQVVLRGKVKAIHDRDVELVVGEKTYRLRLGQTLDEALRPGRSGGRGAEAPPAAATAGTKNP